MKLMQAVPNISEGRNMCVIQTLAETVRQTPGVHLLHTDSNADANRTVFTFAGAPQAVADAALALITQAAQLIDMRTQRGAHPRLGATDVCPFVPLKSMTLTEAAGYARVLGEQTARLGIPVYFYEANAQNPERKDLAFIRKGGYESLPQKLKDLQPDLGPSEFSPAVARTGATVIGARNILIAFNVSLNTTNIAPAKEIASVLRAKNGGLPYVKAIGWLMPGYHAAQVSFNLTDYHASNLQDAFEACKQEAAKRGLAVTGSELIGLAPEEAFLQAGKFYAPNALTNEELIQAAVTQLGLNKIHPFHPQERILEYLLKMAVSNP